MSDLEQILSDEPLETVAVEEVQEVGIEQPRDDSGRFASKGENDGASPAQEEPKAELDHAALLGERRRRQEAEEQTRLLQEQLQQIQNPPLPPPDVFDEGFGQHIETSAVTKAVQAATFNSRLDMSEMMMRQQQPDFDEMKDQFLALMQENPTLQQQALSDPHPWNKAYQIAKNHKTMQQLGATNIDDMTAKIRAQLEAEYAAKAPQIPNSLADAQSARNGVAPTAPPLSLADILSG